MQTNPESAAVEAVAWDYSPEHRIAVTDGKGGVTMTLNGHGAPAGISLYHGDYVSELQSALDALRGEVAENEGVIRVWRRRCEEGERRVVELNGVLSDAVGSLYRMDITKLNAGDKHTLDVLLDRLQTALTKESP